jgi:hypothetical protein
MRQIRHSVFETNSSSTHSISISNDVKTLDPLCVDENGVVAIDGQGFGWEYETYTDAQSKASYAMIYAHEWSGEKKDEHIRILTDVIKQQTGCKEVVYNYSDQEWDSGKTDKPWG